MKMGFTTLNKCKQFKINDSYTFISKKLVLLVFLLCFSFFNIKAQEKNVEVRFYALQSTKAGAFTGSGFTKLNGGSIDGYVKGIGQASMPTSVDGYKDIDIVVFDIQYTPLSSSQASAVVQFARNGGIVIAAVEYGYANPTNIYDNTNYNTLMTALFGAGHGGITKSRAASPGINPTKFTHPNYGTLLLNNATGTLDTPTSGSYSSFSGVPSENRITQGVGAATGCDATALDIIYPAFPGSAIQQKVGGVDFNGIFILSGEYYKILGSDTASGGSTIDGGRSLAFHQAFTKLFYDFLHNPKAMEARRNWSRTSTNVNSSCPAAKHPLCAAGIDPPKF